MNAQAMPAYPAVNPFEPSTTDLLRYAEYLSAIADGCDIQATPERINSPWCVIGRLREASRELQRLIQRRIEGEQAEADFRAQMTLEQRDEPRELQYGNFDRDTGIRRHGEI